MSAVFDRGLERARALRRGEPVATGWTAIPSAYTAAALARGGFGAVCMDMQHGSHDEASVLTSLQSVHHSGSMPGFRIPVGRYDFASRALDGGAQIVIAPMINTPDDARTFAYETKYPPIGGRSWGPAIALDMWGVTPADYLARANELVVTFAMIETVQALENLDAILDVPGIDGVFVGPSDLSLTLAAGQRIEPLAPHVLETAGSIAQAAKAKGKIAGVYAVDNEKARAYVAQGFALTAIASDLIALKAFAASASKLD
ncbi:MAG: aldolase/citrate lyase family protein [Pseudomonadota bacterium]